jgi:hypothetical protein
MALVNWCRCTPNMGPGQEVTWTQDLQLLIGHQPSPALLAHKPLRKVCLPRLLLSMQNWLTVQHHPVCVLTQRTIPLQLHHTSTLLT